MPGLTTSPFFGRLASFGECPPEFTSPKAPETGAPDDRSAMLSSDRLGSA